VGLIGPLLALGSAVTWGVADFAGGMLSRRLPSAAVDHRHGHPAAP